MAEVTPIHQAKTQLSKLVKRARSGEVIYLGAYGHAEAILAPVPAREPIPLGVWQDRRVPGFHYGSPSLIEPDTELAADLDHALEQE